MPPAIEDDESDSLHEEIAMPVRKGKAQGNGKKTPTPDLEDEGGDDAAAEGEDGDEDGDEDDEELGEDEFIVEKIIGHKYDIKDRQIKFQVKWEGWSGPEGLTWEPEENLKESATEILDDYFASKGGRDAVMDQTKTAIKGKKRGRPSVAAGGDSSSNKRTRGVNDVHPKDKNAGKASEEWKPPLGSWEDLIDNLDVAQSDADGSLLVYATWKNGKQTHHAPQVIYNRAPQMMLRYYENHIKIFPRQPVEVEVQGKADDDAEMKSAED